MSNPDIKKAHAVVDEQWSAYAADRSQENLAKLEAARARLLEIKNDQLKAEKKQIEQERDQLRATLIQRDIVNGDMRTLGFNEAPSPEKKFRAYALTPKERAEALFSKEAGE